jgi:hypothetical protein
MRVTIELDSSALDRPTGRLTLDGHSDSVAFDGWLGLMRLIESLASAGDKHGGRPTTREECET